MSEKGNQAGTKKLQEAHFFLDCLKEIKGQGPKFGYTAKQETTFFLSALLGACYSVIDQQKTPKVKSKVNDQKWEDICNKVHEFKVRNNWLYANSSGLRNKAVHLEVVEGNKAGGSNLAYGSSAYGAPAVGFQALYLKEHKLGNGKKGPVIPEFEDHLEDLEDFVEECEKIKNR